MATTPLCSARGLVGPARRGWTPEEVAQYELALYCGLASNKKAQRVFLQKVRIVETVRAKQHQVVPQLAGSTNTKATTSTGAGGRSSGLSGRPLAAATEPRARRRKSEAQQRKSVNRLQHKWLEKRCCAAAGKVGGSPPRVLARVLACCGRFWELLHPEGAERMARLRQAEAASKQREGDGGLDAMRTALAATSAAVQSTPMDVGGISARHSALAQPSPRSGDAGRAGANAGKQMAQGKAMAAIVRRGLCPGDEQWHSAGKCGWSKPEETSGDDEPEHWPALGPSSGRVVK